MTLRWMMGERVVIEILLKTALNLAAAGMMVLADCSCRRHPTLAYLWQSGRPAGAAYPLIAQHGERETEGPSWKWEKGKFVPDGCLPCLRPGARPPSSSPDPPPEIPRRGPPSSSSSSSSSYKRLTTWHRWWLATNGGRERRPSSSICA